MSLRSHLAPDSENAGALGSAAPITLADDTDEVERSAYDIEGYQLRVLHVNEHIYVLCPRTPDIAAG
ncbi:MAG TPA: hypothetical protein VEH31_15245 [Streptosporangiaceae bacterium]|nr:hypothetical protein [Streptosporangiaceae bacterium]